MSEASGIKMRIIALDELMKCCVEIGRSHDNPQYKEFAKTLYEVAQTRREFLAASRAENEE